MAITYTAIATTTVGAGGAANITFSSIPGTYTDLVVKFSLRNTDGRNISINLNGSTSSRSYRLVYGTGSAAGSESGSIMFAYANAPATTASTFSNGEAYIPNYAGSNNKSMSVDSIEENNGATAYSVLSANLWSDTSAVTSVVLVPSAGNFVQYSTATLYGIKNTV